MCPKVELGFYSTSYVQFVFKGKSVISETSLN